MIVMSSYIVNAPVDIDVLRRQIFADGLLDGRRMTPDEMEQYFRGHNAYRRSKKRYTNFELPAGSALSRWEGHLSVWWASVMTRDMSSITLKQFFHFLADYADKLWLPFIQDESLIGIARAKSPYNVSFTLPQLLFWNRARYNRPTTIQALLDKTCPQWKAEIETIWLGEDPDLHHKPPLGLSFTALGTYNAPTRLALINLELAHVSQISLPLARDLFTETLQYRGDMEKAPANIKRCVIASGFNLDPICRTNHAKPKYYAKAHELLNSSDKRIAEDWIHTLLSARIQHTQQPINKAAMPSL